MTILKYPLEAGGIESDYVAFTPEKYRPNQENVGFSSTASSGPPADAGVDPIILYMPNSTPPVANTNSWGKVEFGGPLGDLRRELAAGMGSTMANSMAAGGVGDTLGAAGQGLLDTAGATFDNAKKNIKGIAAQLMMKKVGQKLSVTPNQQLALGAGQVFNPNVELLYEAPQMRSFSMAFDFVPKSPVEARQVNNIILAFKKWSSPKTIPNGMFEVPYIWKVVYKRGKAENIFMNRFKKAALTNVQVVANQPTDMHVTYTDGMPIITSMQLNFMEVDIVTRDDHEKVGGQGY